MLQEIAKVYLFRIFHLKPGRPIGAKTMGSEWVLAGKCQMELQRPIMTFRATYLHYVIVVIDTCRGIIGNLCFPCDRKK